MPPLIPSTVDLGKAAIKFLNAGGEVGREERTNVPFHMDLEGGNVGFVRRRRTTTTFLEKWHAVLTAYTDPPALNLDKGGAAISGVRSKSKRSGAISR